MIKMYYSPELDILEDYRIIPPPKISIQQNLVYANDQVIGYTYTIDFNGFATNYIASYTEEIVGGDGDIQSETGEDISTENLIQLITENTTLSSTPNSINFLDANITSILKVLYHIEYIRKLFSANGNTLTIRDDQNNNLLVAKGGILRSLSFQESPNIWTKYCTYTASIEFNELILLDDNFNCSTPYVYANSSSSGLVDITKYKIASFTDNWSFSLEDDSLNYSNLTDLRAHNTRIGVSYSLSATGKSYFIEDQVYPAWLQAKNFVQDRLYNQINNLDKVLSLNGPSCDSTKNLSDLHDLAGSGLMNNVSNSFKLYNEKVTCEASESEGSFSLNYTAILKKDENTTVSADNVIHTFSKEYSVNKEGTRSNVTINITGNIEGLYEGGLVKTSGNFSLPKNGTLLIGASNNNRFDNAETFLNNKIIEGDNLKPSFYTALGVTLENLALDSGVVNLACITGIPPASFNLTKNFMEGTISYNASYNTSRACSRENLGLSSVNKTTVSVDVATPVIAEFAVPQGDYIVQDIGTVTARRVTINSQGKVPRNCCINGISDILVLGLCNLSLESFLPFVNFPDPNLYILTAKQYTTDPIQGTYSFNLSYICNTGCIIP